MPDKDEIILTQELSGETEGTQQPGEEESETAEEKTADAEKTVPLAALRKERAEKRRLREELARSESITKRLMESTGSATLSDLEAKLDEAQKMRVMRERGLDEKTAQMILEMQKENSRLRENAAERSLDRELSELALDPYYDDISEVRDAVEEYARGKNLTVREAYNALYGEEKARKLQSLARKEALEARGVMDSKKIKGLSSAGNSPAAEGSLGLTPSELAVARLAGLSPAEYKKYKE